MLFLLIIKQKGEGCDYTVGCGTRLYEFGADTHALAAKLALKKLADCGFLPSEDCGMRDDRMLDKHYLFELNEQTMLPTGYDEELSRLTELDREATVKEQQAKDQAEFERLRKKLGR